MKLKRFLCLLGALIAVFVFTIVPIGAEVTPPTPPTFDSSTIYDYPGGNLVKYPYLSFPTSGVVVKNGVTFTLQDYGIIISAGQSSATTIVTIGNLDLPAGTYSISGSAAPAVFIAEGYVNGAYVGSWRDTTFTLTQQTRLTLMIYMGSGYTAGGTIYPMINVGSTAYPFQPYLPYYFQQAFNAGWNQSYESAYYAGQDDAFDVLNGSIISVLTQASYSAVLSFEGSVPDVTVSFTPNFTFDGIFFRSLLTQLQARPDWETCDRVTLVLSWTQDKSFSFIDVPIYLSGNALFSSGRVYDFNGRSYALEADRSSLSIPGKLELEQDVSSAIIVSQLDLYVGRPEDLLYECYISTTSSSYNRGYDVGYADGYDFGINRTQDQIRDEYYDNGYSAGYQVGKTEGLSIAENGTWTGLFTSVVEAPVNTFQSLFNFEILGLDMRAAFGSILALCVVLIIVKKVIL